MKAMGYRKGAGLFGRVAVRAVEDALYERLLDEGWAELKKVFERRDVQEAEALIMRAIADAFAPAPQPSRRRKA